MRRPEDRTHQDCPVGVNQMENGGENTQAVGAAHSKFHFIEGVQWNWNKKDQGHGQTQGWKKKVYSQVVVFSGMLRSGTL